MTEPGGEEGISDWSSAAVAPLDWKSPDWATPDAYDHLLGVDRAGIMWEWLRRDARYRAWYVRASQATGGTIGPALEWGLHFR